MASDDKPTVGTMHIFANDLFKKNPITGRPTKNAVNPLRHTHGSLMAKPLTPENASELVRVENGMFGSAPFSASNMFGKLFTPFRKSIALDVGPKFFSSKEAAHGSGWKPLMDSKEHLRSMQAASLSSPHESAMDMDLADATEKRTHLKATY